MKNSFSQKTFSLSQFWLVLLMVVCGCLAWMVIDNGHDCRGDFAMYISQGQSLLDGTILELYEVNKFSMDNSEIVLGPYLYQTGFPILIAGVLLIFGMNLIAMKWLCAASLIFSIPLLFRLFRPYFDSDNFSFVVVLIAVFNSSYLIFCDSILSDFPFLFLSLLVFILIKRNPTILNQLVLGLAFYFAYITRDIGIVLLPMLVVFQLHKFSLGSSDFSQPKVLIVPYLVFGVFMVLGTFLLPAGQENQFKAMLSNLNGLELHETFKYYRWLINDFFYFPQTFHGFFYLIVLLSVLGSISVFKRAPHFVVYVVLSLSVLMVWPHKQGMRFLFPLLPFLVFFSIVGLVRLFERFTPSKWLTSAVVLGYLCFSLVQGYTLVKEYAIRDTNACHSETHQMMYEYIKRKVPKDALVASYYPRIMRLFTGVNGVRTSWENPIIEYVQTSTNNVSEEMLAHYLIEYVSGDEILLKRKKPTLK